MLFLTNMFLQLRQQAFHLEILIEGVLISLTLSFPKALQKGTGSLRCVLVSISTHVSYPIRLFLEQEVRYH